MYRNITPNHMSKQTGEASVGPCGRELAAAALGNTVFYLMHYPMLGRPEPCLPALTNFINLFSLRNQVRSTSKTCADNDQPPRHTVSTRGLS